MDGLKSLTNDVSRSWCITGLTYIFYKISQRLTDDKIICSWIKFRSLANYAFFINMSPKCRSWSTSWQSEEFNVDFHGRDMATLLGFRWVRLLVRKVGLVCNYSRSLMYLRKRRLKRLKIRENWEQLKTRVATSMKLELRYEYTKLEKEWFCVSQSLN